MLIQEGSNIIEINIWPDKRNEECFQLSVCVNCWGFNGKLENLYLKKSDFDAYLSELRALEHTRQGKAWLATDDPRQFMIEISALDKLGHMRLAGEIRNRINKSDEAALLFSFALDPSTLPHIFSGFKSLRAPRSPDFDTRK